MLRYILLAVALAHAPDARSADEPYCKDDRFPRAPRCFVVLDSSPDTLRGGINVVFVDNASSMLNSQVADLVLTADRSTQNGSPQKPPYRKGLMRGGDRVCVTDRYLAWFDYTKGDGVLFEAPYGNEWARAGTLAGFWALDPATGTFRYPRASPDGSGGKWAHNELVPGSASPDGGQFWWDQHAPPVEHTLVVPTNGDPDWDFYFFSYQFAMSSPKSGWAITSDGGRDSDGVHYKTTALMTSWRGKVDVVDGEDEQDIKNTVRASLEYICRPDDIVMVWRFSPERADIVVNNLYVAMWLAYAGDNDGTARCDPAPGEQWPNQTYGQPLYVRSSERLLEWSGPGQFRFLPPGDIARLAVHTPPCDRRTPDKNFDYYNTGVFTDPAFGTHAGSWIDIGESPGLSAAAPTWRFMTLDEPLTGAGTADDPQRIGWSDLNTWHENADSTIGIGAGNAGNLVTLRRGVWYQSAISIRSLP